MRLASISWGVLLICLLGCGTVQVGSGDSDESSKSDNNYFPDAMALGSLDDLPDCGDDNANQLVYVIDLGAFYVCDGDWDEIDVQYNEQPESVWRHPDTGVKWIKSFSATDRDYECSDGYHKPQEDEGYDAIRSGLLTHFSAADLWMYIDEWGQYLRITANEEEGGSTGTSLGFCVED